MKYTATMEKSVDEGMTLLVTELTYELIQSKIFIKTFTYFENLEC
jgi:hypothetical protein